MTAAARFAFAAFCMAAGLWPGISSDALGAGDEVAPKSIVELQAFRRSETTVTQSGALQVTATLADLNPNIHAWYLLSLDWSGSRAPARYHIENPGAVGQTLRLDGNEQLGLLISGPDRTIACDPWSGSPSQLEQGRATGLPYAPICNGLLYLRNPVTGHQTSLERVTGFLRDHVWKGDAIVGFVRGSIYRDAFRETGDIRPTPQTPAPETSDARPVTASVNASYVDMAAAPKDLGIDIAGPASGQLGIGRWYPARNVTGVYVSLIQPQAVTDRISDRDRKSIAKLDAIESSALDYLVAFDLSRFDLGFALGTDHPRLDWSARVPETLRDARLPGPDGVADAAPLARTGMVSPSLVDKVAATFTGGFKREHGAFRYGELATRNRGSHYGFVEQGVVFSKLQPGLATLYVTADGSVNMKTWTEEDNSHLAQIRFARQNGVPLVEPDLVTGLSAPGRLVANWGAGNWSGSADEKLRTLRAGACLQETGGRRFLIYGYFSTATPSAMSVVFQAYRCRYAMLLDINALEHTYLAIYSRHGDKLSVEHLISGMAEVDRSANGQLIPRFLAFPDNRDFFYLTRRGNGS